MSDESSDYITFPPGTVIGSYGADEKQGTSEISKSRESATHGQPDATTDEIMSRIKEMDSRRNDEILKEALARDPMEYFTRKREEKKAMEAGESANGIGVVYFLFPILILLLMRWIQVMARKPRDTILPLLRSRLAIAAQLVPAGVFAFLLFFPIHSVSIDLSGNVGYHRFVAGPKSWKWQPNETDFLRMLSNLGIEEAQKGYYQKNATIWIPRMRKFIDWPATLSAAALVSGFFLAVWMALRPKHS